MCVYVYMCVLRGRRVRSFLPAAVEASRWKMSQPPRDQCLPKLLAAAAAAAISAVIEKRNGERDSCLSISRGEGTKSGMRKLARFCEHPDNRTASLSIIISQYEEATLSR